jgi:hypothetical protein
MSTLALSADPLPLPAVARLFERMRGQMGAKLADLLAGANIDVVQQEWAAGLAGFSREELSRGLSAVRQRRFAPTLGEFLQLCRPALDPEYAFLEAQDGLRARAVGELGVWTHPAVWRAASAMSFDVKNGTFQQLRKRWERALEREFSRGWGDDVPQPAARIENNPVVMAIPPDVRRQLAELATSFRRIS